MRIPVDRGERIDKLLRRHNLQQYKIEILLRVGAVKRWREERLVLLKRDDERVEEGDTVIVDDEGDAARRALADIPDGEFRDYVFAPIPTQKGLRPFAQDMAALLALRPETIRIDDPPVATFKDFIQALTSSPQVTAPIRNLFLASHASATGMLLTPLGGDPTTVEASDIAYWDLEKAVTDKTIRVPDDTLKPRPKGASGQPDAPRLQIRGCRIGEVRPFLVKLKEALGGGLTVVAPKFAHGVSTLPEPRGRFESLLYAYTIRRKAPLQSHEEAVEVFDAHKFPMLDGTQIPRSRLDRWIPSTRSIRKAPHTVGPPVQWPVVGAPVRLRVSKGTFGLPGQFKYFVRQIFKPPSESDQGSGFPLEKDPGSDAKRLDEVRKFLVQMESFKPSHPFPMFQQLGWTSMDEFMTGPDWRVHFDSANKRLRFHATQHEYTVEQPIVDTDNKTLFANFFPMPDKRGVVRGKPDWGLPDNDPRFFAIV
jgi:hypothetical protein